MHNYNDDYDFFEENYNNDNDLYYDECEDD